MELRATPAPLLSPHGAGVGVLDLSVYLGPDASFVGTLSLAGTVRIDGSVDGEILGPSLLILGPSARIRGKVQAGAVVVLGATVTADLDVRGAIELRQGATVVGTLTAAEIHMDPDIEFRGTCDLQPTRSGPRLTSEPAAPDRP